MAVKPMSHELWPNPPKPGRSMQRAQENLCLVCFVSRSPSELRYSGKGGQRSVLAKALSPCFRDLLPQSWKTRASLGRSDTVRLGRRRRFDVLRA